MSVIQQVLLGVGQPPKTYATWNPSDKGAAVTLSGGNLSASVTPVTAMGAVRATQGKSSGKWYWEITITGDETSPYATEISVSTSAAVLSGGIRNSAEVWLYAAGGGRFHNGYVGAYGANYTTGDVIGVALDMDAGTITFYKNGVSQGQCFYGLSGVMYPTWSADYNSAGTCTCTANFGATTFAYSVPSGFNGGVFV